MRVTDEDLGWQDIIDNIEEVQSKESVTGFFQDDIEDGIGLAELMAVHEFGSPERSIPERPAMRMTADSKEKDIIENMFAIGDKMIFENLDSDLGYQVIGDFYLSEFQNGVASQSLGLKANAQSTIERKGSSTPLIDSSRLINGINTRVEDV